MSVSEWLTAEGVLATRGSQWTQTNVRKYLLNPKLAGYSTLAGEIVGEGQWSPILDRDTWETIRALLAARTMVRPPRVALLGGLLFCGRCGHRLITSRYGRKGNTHRSYRCPNRVGMRGCGTVSGQAKPVEEIVEAYARRRLAESPTVRARVAALNAVTGAGALLAEIDQLEQRIRELDAELDRPGVPVARLTRALERAQARLEACQGELAEALTAEHAVRAHEAYAGKLAWPGDLATRRLLVATALGGERVYLDPLAPGHWNPSGFDVRRVRIGEQRAG
jgi:site-specific DNA recombinase